MVSKEVPSAFQIALEAVERLMPEDQEMLVEIVRGRLAERRRAQLSEDIAAAWEAYRYNDVRRGTVEDLVVELTR
jgi:hypothetical protein